MNSKHCTTHEWASDHASGLPTNGEKGTRVNEIPLGETCPTPNRHLVLATTTIQVGILDSRRYLSW